MAPHLHFVKYKIFFFLSSPVSLHIDGKIDNDKIKQKVKNKKVFFISIQLNCHQKY